MYPVVHAGGVDVTTTDGVQKRFADGDVLLVEDTTGHCSLPFRRYISCINWLPASQMPDNSM